MKQRSILLVEDDVNDVFFFKHALEHAEVPNPLNIVADGQEAIEYLSGDNRFSDREQYPLPSVLVLDLKMPRKTGLEALEWIRAREQFNCLPVIIFSSSAHREDVVRAYELGANAFIVKPPGIAARTRFAKSLKEFWLDFNEAPAIDEGTADPVHRDQKKHR